jgi:hypothetical protein
MLPTAAFMIVLSQAAPVSDSAVDVSTAWLTALAHGDSRALRQLSRFPLVVEGFQYNERPEQNVCDRVPGMVRNPKTREIRVSARTEAEFDTMIACVLADNAAEEWIKGSNERRFVGKARLLASPAHSGRRVARYRKVVAPLAKTRTLVEAVTSQDGVTLTALLVLGRTPSGSFGVESVHIDFLFEE